jgi:hypothetical protein
MVLWASGAGSVIVDPIERHPLYKGLGRAHGYMVDIPVIELANMLVIIVVSTS